MHVITHRHLLRFASQHPESAEPFDAWYRMMKRKDYEAPNELKVDFASVSFLGGELTVFNIGGNKFRLVAFVVYHRRRIFIHRILTHAEYDRQSRDSTLEK